MINTAPYALKKYFGNDIKNVDRKLQTLVDEKKISQSVFTTLRKQKMKYSKKKVAPAKKTDKQINVAPKPAVKKVAPKPSVKKKETPKAKPPTKTWQKYAEKYKPFTSKGEWDKVLGLEWKRKSISPTKVVWVGTLKGGVRVETILEWKTNSRDSEEYKTINGKRITGRPDFADRLNKMVDDIESKEKMSKMMKPSDIVNIVKNA